MYRHTARENRTKVKRRPICDALLLAIRGQTGMGSGIWKISDRQQGSLSVAKFLVHSSSSCFGGVTDTFTLCDFQAPHTPDARALDSSARPPAARVSTRRAWKIIIIFAGRREAPEGLQEGEGYKACERRKICERARKHLSQTNRPPDLWFFCLLFF